MCLSTGKSASKRAAREAEQAEVERKAQIEAGTSTIDRAFGARGPQYDRFVEALRQHYQTDLGRQKADADRQLRFSLARGGLTGGSVAADAGTRLGREFTEGILESERQAQLGLADLKARDESTRMNLMSLVQGGADATSAAQQAARAMQTNIAGARGEGLARGLGDMFGGTADLYRRQQESAAERRGLRSAFDAQYGDPFSR
jgi:hypothetical protein